MSGRASRDKGSRGERELVELLNGARIRARVLTARRVPLSGAMKNTGFGGDVLVGEPCEKCSGRGFLSCIRYDPILGKIHDDLYCQDCHGNKAQLGTEEIIEVKRRGQGFKKIDQWLEDSFAVCYRRDHGEWIITLRLSDLVETESKSKEMEK